MNARQYAAQWMFKETWGFDRTPKPDEMQIYAKALLACANGDGRLEQSERDWVIGLGAALGFSESALEELKNDTAQDDPAKLVSKSPVLDAQPVRLSIVYDAVRASGADGEVSDGERQTIYRMAKALDITQERVDAVIAQYESEQRVRASRLELIYGQAPKPY